MSAPFRIVFGLCFGLIISVLAVAQPPAKPDFPALTGERAEVDEKEVPKSAEISMVIRFALSPEIDNVISSDADKAVVDKVLKYYLYRLTWEEVQKEEDPASVGSISSIMTELIGSAETNPRLLPRPFSGQAADQDMAAMRQRQMDNVRAMTPIFIKHCRVLLTNRLPIARINAVRVLGKLADWGQEPVIDELVRVINHPQEIDAVRHHAFRGLEEIFVLQGSTELKAKGLFQSKEGQTRFGTALNSIYNWLDSRTKVPETRLQFMKKEEQAGLRYVRRAAALALGAGRRPLIVDDRQGGKQEGPIAELLGKIVVGDAALAPQPDLRERLDAAIALCQLRADYSPSYQPDFAAHQIGVFLTALGAEANANQRAPVKMFAWGWEAQRLKTALDGFAAQKVPGPVASYLSNFNSKVRPLLEFFDDSNKNTDSVSGMNEWVRGNAPASRQVYRPLGER